MKKTYILILLCCLTLPAFATNWYNNTSSPLQTLGSWGPNSDGSGTAPTNFTTVGDTFNLVNGATGTITGIWGLSATLLVGDGVHAMNFTLPIGASTITGGGTVSVAANGTLTLNNTTIPTLGVFATTSTVIYNVAAGGQTVAAKTYGNLTLANTSATQTAAGAITVNGTLTTTSGGTFSMSTFQLTGSMTVVNNGTISTSNTTNPAIPAGLNWTGTTGAVTFAAAGGAQSIPLGTYNKLTSSTGTGTNSVVPVSGVGTGTLYTATLVTVTGGSFSMGGNILSATAVTNGGTLRTAVLTGTSTTPIPALIYGGTVNYSSTTGGQTIVSTTYNSLSSSAGAAATQTAGGDLTVSGVLTTAGGGTLDMGNFLLTETGAPTNNGIIKTQNANGIPSGKVWAGTINYYNTTGGQTIAQGTYTTLIMGNTSGTQTAGGNLVVNTALNVPVSTVLDMTTNTLTGTLTTVTNNGTIQTQVTSPALPFASGRTWGGTGYIKYNGSSDQTIMGGTYTDTLVITGARGGGVITLSPTATISVATAMLFTATGIGSYVNAGNTVNYSRALGGQTIISQVQYNNLTSGNGVGSSSNSPDGDLTVAGTLTTTASGTLDLLTNKLLSTTAITNAGTIKTQNTTTTPIPSGLAIAGTVNYNATSGGQTVIAEASYNNLTLGNTSGTQTAAGDLAINGTLTTTANGTLDMTSAYVLGGTLATITNNGTIQTEVPTATSGIPLSSGKTWGGTGTINYAGSGSQTIVTGIYTNTLTISARASGTVTLAAGTISIGSVLTAGSLGSGSYANTGNTVTYTKLAGTQTIASAVTYNNLTCSNNSGTNTVDGNLTINGTLTTTASGILSMSTFQLATLGSLVNNGIISTSCLANPALPISQTWSPGGVTFSLTTGGQFIPTGSYKTLTCSNTTGTNTVSNGSTPGAGDTIVSVTAGVLTTSAAAAGILDMSTFALGGAPSSISNAGTLKTSYIGASPIPSGYAIGGIVNYAAGGQTVAPETSYATLTISSTSGTDTAGGNLVVNTLLSIPNSGGILKMTDPYTLGGTLTTVTNNGFIKTATLTSSSATPIPIGKNWGGTGYVQYDGAGAQTIVTGTYTDTLKISHARTGSPVMTLGSGNINIGSALQVTTTGVGSWSTTGNTVIYTKGTGLQTVNTIIPYNNLTVSNASGADTVDGNLTVNGTLTTTTAGTFGMGAFNMAVAPASIVNNGTISTASLTNPALPIGKTWTGATGLVSFTVANGGQYIPTGNYKALTISNTSGIDTVIGGLAANGDTIVTLTGGLTTTAGGTLAMGPSTLAITGGTGNNGIILTKCTNSTPLPSGKGWAGIVGYRNNTGGQTIVAGTYSNLAMGAITGTNTAGAAFTVTVSLTVPAGDTLDMSTFPITGALTTITNNGMIQTECTTATPFPAAKTYGGAGTIMYDAPGGGQTVVSGTYNDTLLINNTGTTTASGTLTVNTALNVASGATLAMATNQLAGTLLSLTNNGTITTASVASPALPLNEYWKGSGTGSVQFTVSGGGQFIPAGTYGTLTMVNIAGTNKVVTGDLYVDTLNISSATGTLDMQTNNLFATYTNNTGTIKTQSTGATPLPSGLAWGGTVNYNAGSGAQTIASGSYTNLTMGNATGTMTAHFNLNVSGTLTTTSGGLLDMATFTLVGPPASIVNNGSITTSSVNNPALPAGLNWSGTTGVVTFALTSGAQFIPTGTYKTLTVLNGVGSTKDKVVGGDINVTGVLTTTASGTFDLASNALVEAGAPVNNGTIETHNTASTAPLPAGKSWGGVVNYAKSTGTQSIVAGTYTTLTMSNTTGTDTARGGITVNTALTVPSGDTLDMSTFAMAGTLATITNGGTIQTECITATPFATGKNWAGAGVTGNVIYNLSLGTPGIIAGTYNNLYINNSGFTNTATGTITVDSALYTTSGGTLSMSTFQLKTGAFSPINISNAGTVTTTCITNPALPADQDWSGGGAGTVKYSASGQSISVGTYGALFSTSGAGTNNVVVGPNAGDTILTVNTQLTTVSGGTMAMNALQLAFGGSTTVTNNGTITTKSIANPAIPPSRDWTGTTGLVTYALTSGNQFVSTGTYRGLTFSHNSNTDLVVSGPGASDTIVNLTGALTTTAGGTLDMGSNTLNVGGAITNGGFILTQCVNSTPLPSPKTWTGTVIYNGTAAQSMVPGTFTNLTLSGTRVSSPVLTLDSGVISVSGTFTDTATGIGSYVATNNTFKYTTPGGSRTIYSAIHYFNLTIGNAIGTNTVDGNLIVNDTLVTTSGGTLAMTTFQLSGPTFVTNSGTITTACTAYPAIPTGLVWTGTTGLVNYSATAGGQYISTGTYKTLTISANAGSTKDTVVGGPNPSDTIVTVTGVLTTAAGGIVDMAANTLSEAGVPVSNGTIMTECMNTTPLTAGKTWGGTVNYYNPTSGQSVVGGTYATLTLSGLSGTDSARAGITVNTALNVGNGDTLDMSTFAMAGTLTTITNGGTIQTECSTASPFTTGKNWAGVGVTGTVIYNLTLGTPAIMAGTYNNLTVNNSGFTNTAGGAITIDDTLITTNGGTLAMAANQLKNGGSMFVINPGTITTTSLANPAIPADMDWSGGGTSGTGVVKLAALTGVQFIPVGSYATLNSANTSGTNTVSAGPNAADTVITVEVALTTASAGTFALNTNQLSLISPATVTNNGTVNTKSVANPALPTGQNWQGTTGTVAFSLVTGGQFIPTGTYKTITCSNSSDTDIVVSGIGASDTIVEMSGVLTTTAGGALDMGTNTLDVGGAPVNNGTLITECSNSLPITESKTWAGIVDYNGTGGQTLVNGKFSNLILSGARAGSPTITLETTSVTGDSISLSGNFTVNYTGTVNFDPTDNIFTYTGNTANTVGGINYYDLNLRNSAATKTAGGTITINDGLLTTAGGTLAMSTFQILDGSGLLSLGSTQNNGTINTACTINPAMPLSLGWSPGVVIFSSLTGQQYIPTGIYQTLTCQNTSDTNRVVGGDMIVLGTFTTTALGGTVDMGINKLQSAVTTNTGTLLTQCPTSHTTIPIPQGKVYSGTVNYNAPAGLQTVVVATYNNLTLSDTGGTQTAGGNVTVNGTLTTNGGILDMVAGVLTGGVGMTPAGLGTIRTANTAAGPIKTGLTWTQTVEYYKTTGLQTIVVGTYAGLTNSNTSATNKIAVAGNVLVSGNLTLTAGSVLDDNGTNIKVNGNIAGSGTHNKTAAGQITLQGSSSQSISGATLGNLTLNNSVGFTLTGNALVNGTLTLTSGNLALGVDTLVLGTTAPAVAGTPSDTNMIIATGSGRLRKLFTANGSYVFPIGDATPNYSPVTVNVTAGTYGAGAYVGANVANTKHPNNANTTDYLNRYWNVSTNIGSPTYSFTGNYVAGAYPTGDVTGTEGNISSAQYTGSLPWIRYATVNTSLHTVSVSGLSSSAGAFSGISSANPSVAITPSDTTVCSGASFTLNANGIGDPTLTYVWAPSTNLSATTGSSVTVTPTATVTTTYVYTVTMTDGNGFTAPVAFDTIVVNPLPVVGPITGTTGTLPVGYTSQLSDATGSGTWTSTNTSVVTVNGSGLVTALGGGTATISYTVTNGCGSSAATATFTVTPGNTWYSVTTGGDASVLGNWWSTNSNSGINPVAFTNTNDVWVFQSNMTCSTTPYTLAGSVSIVSGGTFTAPATFNVGGFWSNTGGTFTHNGGTVVMTTTVTATPISGSLTGSSAFNNLTFNGTGSWTFAGNAADLAGNFTITSGAVTAPSTTLNVGGSWNNGGTYTNNSGTVVMTSTGSGNTLSGAMTGSNGFNVLTFNGVAGAWSFGANSADVAANFTITNGTVTAPSTTLTVTGNWSNSGTFTNNSGTVLMNGTTLGMTLGGSMTGSSAFDNLTFNGVSGAWAFGANADVAGAFTITNGAVTAPSALNVGGNWVNNGTFTNNSGTVTLNATTTGNTLTGGLTGSNGFNNLTFNGVGGAWSFAANAADVSNNFTITNGVVTAPSTTLQVAGSWSNSGTFTNNGGTVNMNGTTSALTLSGAMTGTSAFNILTFNGVSGAWSFGANAADVANNFTITNGTVTAPSSTLQVAGSWSNSGTFTNNGGTVTMNGTTGALTLAGAMTGSSKFNNLTFNGSGGAWSFGANAADVNNNFTITAGTVTAPSSTLQVAGNWSNSGTFTNNSGTVTMNSTTSGKTLAGTMTGSNAFSNLTFNGSGGAWSFGSNAADVNNNFTITAGTVTAPSSTLQVAGTWSNSGTFTHNSGTVTMTGSGAGLTLAGTMTSSSAFNNLTFNGTGSWTFGANAADVNGNYTITAGTVTAPSTTLQVTGNWSNSGTFTHHSGTVAMVGTTAGLTLTGTISGSSAFNNLTFNGVGGAWSFANSSDVDGTFTITNGTVTAPAANLALYGDFLSTGGTFVNNSGAVDLFGSGAQQLGSVGGPAITFYDLVNNVSGTKTCVNGINVTNSLTPGGSAVLASGGNLTMKSNSTGTSYIATGSSAGGYVTGNVTVERFIPANARREWRLLGIPTNSAQTIQQAWQEGATSKASNPVPGFGTEITTAPPYDTTSGFDEVNSGSNGSVEQYDVATNGFSASKVTNTDTQIISSQPGYFLFVKGDRTCTLGNSTITSTTLRTVGPLYTGDQSSVTVTASKMALVGNPYPSEIDFSLIAAGDRTNLVNEFYLWDPKLGTTGGYQLFTASSGFVPVPGGGSYGSSAHSIIESGAAFFVQSSGAAGAITLRESHKVTGSNNSAFKSMSGAQILNVNLNLVDKDGTATLADGVRAIFSEDGAALVDENDGAKMMNVNEGLSILRDLQSLSLEERPLVKKTDTIFLNIQNMDYRKYQMLLSPRNFGNSGLSAFLYDSYKNTYTPVGLEGDYMYDFSVDANSASSIGNRFMIIFNYSPVVNNTQTGIVLYPNPVESQGVVNLSFTDQVKGDYKIRLFDNEGTTIMNSEIQHKGLNNAYPLTLPSLSAGVYNVEIIKPNQSKVIIKTLIK